MLLQARAPFGASWKVDDVCGLKDIFFREKMRERERS